MSVKELSSILRVALCKICFAVDGPSSGVSHVKWVGMLDVGVHNGILIFLPIKVSLRFVPEGGGEGIAYYGSDRNGSIFQAEKR